jgi:hypothetical protein
MNADKLLSGRFIAFVLVTITYCAIVVITCLAYLDKVTAEKLEGFAMGLVIGFATFAGKLLMEYFARNDRIPRKDNSNENKRP